MSADGEEPDRAIWFYREVVEPTVVGFLSKPDDIRLGCLACIALSSMVEHYFHARRQEFQGQNAQEFRRSLGSDSAVEIVFDVANATKHVVTGRKRDMDFNAVSTMELDEDTYKSDKSPDDPEIDFGDLELPKGSHVMVPVGNGLYCLLAGQVEAANEMWCTKLGLG
jgi:hypothetical protein